MRSCNMIYICAVGVFLAGCGTKPIQPSDKHIQQQTGEPAATSGIPETVKRSVALPPPKPATKVETYSVVVTNVPAQEILFALARDAKINLDIHPGIQGTVTVNAINQTLPQILTRIAKQVDMRYELDNGYPDRDAGLSLPAQLQDRLCEHGARLGRLDLQLHHNGRLYPAAAPAEASGGSNNSSLTIKNTSKNHFWETLIQNIKDILHETDKILPAGSSETSVQQVREASSTGTGAQPSAGKKKSAPDDDIERQPQSGHRGRRRHDRHAAQHFPRGGLGHRQSRRTASSRCAPPENSTKRSRNSSTRS